MYTFIIGRALATPGYLVFFGGFPGNEAWADQLAYNTRPIDLPLRLMRAQHAFKPQTKKEMLATSLFQNLRPCLI